MNKREKLAEIIWDNTTGEASIVWTKEVQPNPPLPLSQYILLFDAMADVVQEAHRNMADLQRMVKLTPDGKEAIH